MQTLTEQLVKALEELRDKSHLFGDESDNGDAIAGFEHLERLASRALDRYRADPEALLRENGEAVRRTGNELMEGKGR